MKLISVVILLLVNCAFGSAPIAKPVQDNARQRIGVLDVAPPVTCTLTHPTGNPAVVIEGSYINLHMNAQVPGWVVSTQVQGHALTPATNYNVSVYPPQPTLNTTRRDTVYTAQANGIVMNATCSITVRVVVNPCPWLRSNFCTPMHAVYGYLPMGRGCPNNGLGSWTTYLVPEYACITWAAGYPICLATGVNCIIHPPAIACPSFISRIINPGSPGCYLQMPYTVRLSSCFDPDTRIRLADGTWKKISLMTGGDEIFNPVTGKTVKVTGIVAGPEKIPMFEVGFDDKRVKVTRTHPFLTQDGAKQTAKLKLGEKIRGEDGEWHAITVLRKLPLKKKQEVYNFRLETHESLKDEDHWMVAEGIVAGDYTLQAQLDNKKPESFVQTGIIK